MKLAPWILLVSVTFIGLNAHARRESVCESLEECRSLMKQVDQKLKELPSEQAPLLGDLEKGSDGQPLELGFDEAVAHCKSKGSRLPTIRELVLTAIAEGGPRGMIETAYPKSPDSDAALKAEAWKMSSNSYRALYGPSGKFVYFYYDFTGYKTPIYLKGVPEGWTWSSSGSWDADVRFRYILNPFNGQVLHTRDIGAYVRCVL